MKKIKFIEDLYDLEFHDVVIPEDVIDLEILRVPGGWIYKF